jgi:hypothetical protein
LFFNTKELLTLKTGFKKQKSIKATSKKAITQIIKEKSAVKESIESKKVLLFITS